MIEAAEQCLLRRFDFLKDAKTVTILAVGHQWEEVYHLPRNNLNLTPYRLGCDDRAGSRSLSQSILAGLAARTVIVLDSNNVVRHTELVSELVSAIENEPNYDAALAASKAI